MASENTRGPQARSGTLVEDASGRRRFMRGIMVHSLMARGVSFDEAYRVANLVRDKIRGRPVVRRDELAALIEGEFDGRLEPAPLPLPRPITVTDGRMRTPFSKGVMAQSLLAAAVAPDEAFEVAQELEAELVGQKLTEIDRDALRERVADTLQRTRGERVAARYRTWRAFQESDRPMILLLAGAAGVGKTALAQEVAHRLGIARVTSTDSIRQVMRIMLSPELAPALHTSSYDAWQALPALADSEEREIEGFRAQATTVSVGVRAMIERSINENSHMILDGVSIVPGLIDLERYRNDAHLIFLAVATLDPGAYQARFEARARHSARRPPHRYLENLDGILRIQDHLLELADQQGVPIVDNVRFDDSVLSILRHVTETLRKQGGFGEA
ncbi:MAG: ATP cone domain-containing protein [Myxococcota bacterium]